MAEHKRAVKSKDPLNGIAVHVQKTAHNINGKKLGSLQGRTIEEEEGSLRLLRSKKEDPR